MNHSCLVNPADHLAEAHPESFKWVNQMLALFDQARSELGSRGLHLDQLTEYHQILLVSCPKTINSLVSVARLCDAGLMEDANTIARKLIEVAVNLMYMNLDRATLEQKASRFYHHGAITAKSNLDRIEEHPQWFADFLRQEMSSMKPEIQRAYGNAIQHYPCGKKGRINGSFKQHWDGKNLREMIVELGKVQLMTIYTVFSASTHFSADDVASYLDRDNGAVLSGLRSEDIPYLLNESVRLAGVVLRIVDMDFSLGIEDDLEALLFAMEQSDSRH